MVRRIMVLGMILVSVFLFGFSNYSYAKKGNIVVIDNFEDGNFKKNPSWQLPKLPASRWNTGVRSLVVIVMNNWEDK